MDGVPGSTPILHDQEKTHLAPRTLASLADSDSSEKYGGFSMFKREIDLPSNYLLGNHLVTQVLQAGLVTERNFESSKAQELDFLLLEVNPALPPKSPKLGRTWAASSVPLVALCGQTLGSLSSKMITVSQTGGRNWTWR